MRNAKKMIALLLMLLVVLTSAIVLPLATAGFAVDEIILESKVEGGKITYGENFTVTVSLDQPVETQGFGLDYTAAFDRNIFQVVEGEWSAFIAAKSKLSSANDERAVFAFEGIKEVSGEIFTLTLKPTDAILCETPYEIKLLTSSLLPTTAVGATVVMEHSFDNGCDEVCNVCQQKIRDTKHVYDDLRDAECNECHYVREIPTYAQTAHRGDTVTVTVSLTEAIHAQGFGLDFLNAYDREIFQWVSGDWSESIKAAALLVGTNPDQDAVFAAEEAMEISGDVFTFRLKVKEDAVFDDHFVTVGIAGVSDAKLSTTGVTVHGSLDSDETAFDGESHWKICSVCGLKDNNTVKPHVFDGEEDVACDACGFTKYIRGDVDNNKTVDLDDAIYLLYHVNFSSTYPINQSGDFDGNGTADLDDAIYLLYHVNFPDTYPLAPAPSGGQ